MLLFHAVLLILVQISDCVLDWVSCWVCIKSDALLLLRKFWRTKRFIIFDKLIVIKIKKLYVISKLVSIPFRITGTGQTVVSTARTTPICFPRCRQHTVCHIYVCRIRPYMPCACFPVATLIFVSRISCHSTYQHGRIPVEYGQKDHDHQYN